MPGKPTINHIAFLLVLGWGLLYAPCRAVSQTPGILDLGKIHPFFLSLDGAWRFQPGDDLRYADPNFDDSGWASIRGDRSWDVQGYKGLSGFAWYRANIRIPANNPNLGLYVRGIDDSSQIFLDGKLIGSFGMMPPHPRADYQIRRLYLVPLSPSPQPRTISLAIRVWHWPHWAAKFDGGMLSPIHIGDAAFLATFMNLGVRDEEWSHVDGVLLICLWILTGIAAITLFALRRDREYFWFGLYLLLLAALNAFDAWVRFHSLGARDADLIRDFLRCPIQLTEIAFYFYLLRGRRNWLFWVALATSSVIGPALHILVYLEYGNYASWNMVNIALTLPFRLWILSLIARRTRQGLLDAHLLLVPVLIQQTTSIFSTSILVAQYLGWRGNVSWFFVVSKWPFRFSIPDIADLVFLIAMVAIFLFRFYRNGREQEEMKREREAARTVQRILVSDTIRETPGFRVRSVYRPASEVGGDFFQIVPLTGGGALVIIGDVSGKGLPAAMTVSLLVGAARAIIEYTQSPGTILSSLNQHLHRTSSAGFTTCQVLRIDQDGTFTIANAGHFNPWLDGKEVQIDSGLPLGIAPDSTYVEATHLLPVDQQLTVVTDGVVEAMNSKGELYGFDRCALISTQSADDIAWTAQTFGQSDDITVLTVTRLERGDHSADLSPAQKHFGMGS